MLVKDYYKRTEAPVESKAAAIMARVVAKNIIANGIKLKPPQLISNYLVGILQRIGTIKVEEMDIKVVNEPILVDRYIDGPKFKVWLQRIGFKPYECREPHKLAADGIVREIDMGGHANGYPPMYTLIDYLERVFPKLIKEDDYYDCVDNQEQLEEILAGEENALISSMAMFRNALGEETFYKSLEVFKNKVYNINHEEFDITKDYKVWDTVNDVCQGLKIVRLKDYKSSDGEYDDSKHKVFASVYKNIVHADHPEFTTIEDWVENGYLIIYESNQYTLPKVEELDTAVGCRKVIEIINSLVTYVKKSYFQGCTIVAGPKQNHFKHCTLFVAPFIQQKILSILNTNVYNPEFIAPLGGNMITVKPCGYLDRHYKKIDTAHKKDRISKDLNGNNENDDTPVNLIPGIIIQDDDLWKISQNGTKTYVVDGTKVGLEEEVMRFSVKSGYNSGYNGHKLDIKVFHVDDEDQYSTVDLEKVKGA